MDFGMDLGLSGPSPTISQPTQNQQRPGDFDFGELNSSSTQGMKQANPFGLGAPPKKQ